MAPSNLAVPLEFPKTVTTDTDDFRRALEEWQLFSQDSRSFADLPRNTQSVILIVAQMYKTRREQGRLASA